MTTVIYWIAAVVCAALFSYTLTPAVRVFAYKVGAIDVPKDGRRMHHKPIPRVGGLALFIGFALSSLFFCDMTPELRAVLLGGTVIVVQGVLDDIFAMKPILKLLFQGAAAIVAIANGVLITHINLFGLYLEFGVFSYVITFCWIVALTNAINLIDGLDGLACGLSMISMVSLTAVVLLHGDLETALLTAILAGACAGFLPFNSYPAKIFMGDTGSQFLGFALSVLSVQGVFKFHTVLAFFIPVIIFALPLFDTITAILRRVLSGRSPFSADRGHVHHKLIDMGFTQKQTVRILYAICGLLGTAAVICKLFDDETRYLNAGLLIVVAIAIFFVNFLLLRSKSTRNHTGLGDFDEDENTDKPENETEA